MRRNDVSQPNCNLKIRQILQENICNVHLVSFGTVVSAR